MVKRNPKQLHRVLVVSFSILFVCTLFLIYSNFFGKKTEVIDIAPVISSAPIAEPVSDLKSYTSDKYGISFEYPSGYSVKESSSKLEIISPQSICHPPIMFNSKEYKQIYEVSITIKKRTGALENILAVEGGEKYGWIKNTFNSQNGYSLSVGAEMIIPYNRYLIESSSGQVLDIQSNIFGSEDQDKCTPKLSMGNSTKVSSQILSTFKFATPIASPTPSSPPSTKLSYFLPNGWVTQNDVTQTFQVGYDPTSFDATSQEKFISVTRKNLEQSPYYSPYASTTQFSIEPYDGGSRHAFIEKQLGESISSANKTPSYKEKNLIIAGKNCLIISGISISQFPDNWGMCPISSTKAILFTTFNTDIEAFLKTLKFL